MRSEFFVMSCPMNRREDVFNHAKEPVWSEDFLLHAGAGAAGRNTGARGYSRKTLFSL